MCVCFVDSKMMCRNRCPFSSHSCLLAVHPPPTPTCLRFPLSLALAFHVFSAHRFFSSATHLSLWIQPTNRNWWEIMNEINLHRMHTMMVPHCILFFFFTSFSVLLIIIFCWLSFRYAAHRCSEYYSYSFRFSTLHFSASLCRWLCKMCFNNFDCFSSCFDLFLPNRVLAICINFTRIFRCTEIDFFLHQTVLARFSFCFDTF